MTVRDRDILQEAWSNPIFENAVVHLFGKGWLAHYLLRVTPPSVSVRVYENYIHDELSSIPSYIARLENERTAPIRHIVINTASKTSTRWCETHPDETRQSNVMDADDLHELFFEGIQYRPDRFSGVHFVHCSTGCIFNGNDREIDEYEVPNPQIVYSRAKAEAEQRIIQRGLSIPDVGITTIVRPRMPFHEIDEGNNILWKVRRFQKCIDEPNSMVYLTDIVIGIARLVVNRRRGIFNIVNDGAMSPYRLATEFWHREDVEKITTDQLFEQEGIVLTNTLLSNKRIKEVYPEMPSIQDRLSEIGLVAKSAR